MKDGRKISIKHPKLRNLRNNLRKIINNAVEKEFDRLHELSEYYLNKGEKFSKQSQEFRKKRDNISKALIASIIMCSGYDCKEVSEVDMVYDAETDSWYCEKCYAKLKEKRDPKNLFNRGIIVHEDAEKPCHQLRWCPYGTYVERFMIRLGRPKPKSSCLVFGHDCPVFYISEEVSEDSPKRLPPNEKFTESQDWLKFFPSDEFFKPEFEKPCHELDWCPYGPVAELSKKPTEQNHYVCKVFQTVCPCFYLSEGIAESKKMRKIFNQD